jgi:hypothetical protein
LSLAILSILSFFLSKSFRGMVAVFRQSDKATQLAFEKSEWGAMDRSGAGVEARELADSSILAIYSHLEAIKEHRR